MTLIQKLVRFEPEEILALERVRQTYGLESFAQAVRLAARIAGELPRTAISVPPAPKYSRVKKIRRDLAGTYKLQASVDPLADLAVLKAERARKWA